MTVLKTVKIRKKEPLEYFFIGGMTYNTKFSFNVGKNVYPFTSYFIERIEDVIEDGIRYKSLIHCKLPLICLQFKSHCKCIEFNLPIKVDGRRIFPFIGLKEDDDHYKIIFRLFSEFYVKEKKNAWLGISKRKKVKISPDIIKKIKFHIKVYEKKTWENAVLDFFKKQKFNSEKINKIDIGSLMKRVKEALFRSYDDLLGTFIQMPWRNSTGFCMDKYSYSLLGFEAKRLNYFQRLYERTKDPDYLHWVKRLEILFLNKNLYTRKDDGIVWYNTTHFDGKKLRGFFYLDIGYEGYPPGQATISYNIAEYLKSNKNSKLKKILRENLEYILKTQNDDGSWYSALPSGKLKKRAWEISEGSTGSCVRALLKGYEIFKDKRYLEASVKALNFLDRKNIICKNVLRDISISEPEAFSAIVVLDAFLDAFGILKKNKYLKLAERYAKHLLGWIYWHNDFRGFFHPISESISPRISPYETLLLIKTFKRLSKITGEMFWSEIADYLFSKIIDLVDDNYALPEGIFPKMDGSFQYLPMDQTFVTTELLEVLSMYGEYSYKRPKKRRLNIAEKNGYLNLENVVRINTNKFEIYLRGKKLRIDFYSPYDRLSEIKTKLSKMLRILGFLNSARDIKYLVRGVEPPRKSTGSLNSLESYIRSFNINKKEDEVMINVDTRIHDVQINFYRTDRLKMSIKILTKDHDLICNKVLINGKDFTLSSNWTNGGVFKKEFDV